MPRKLADYIKPQPPEAVIRIRNSGLAMSSFILLVYLLDIKPLSLVRCWRVAFAKDISVYGVGPVGWWVNVIELAVLTLLFLNILQCLYALTYPPSPPPPTPASSRKKVAFTPTSSPSSGSKRKLLGASTSTSPSASLSQSQFPFRASASGYPPSPLSTPSRPLNYSLSFPSSSTSLFDSASSSFSSSGIGWSPSKSPLLRYKGKKGGRALDSSLLTHLMNDDSYDE
ncbi:hypothetical protein GLOTRDRAFT_110660 [Gloeophyllum trabeum ATCC 11539]|uniref:Uncharacterized protein n=1 Tax=Gloeophyllum trabeum (strain ATCC 11539 / FP-39264 / Madison 617) TaxID=670483 RepID=S7Q7W5_GLOTA|nr:uncharacterized protein GLOTRDRAFT_110660 [Gloeophyllum trabeum ATCC 11539]EPQ56076.1 hypothetical protein GLOTRDRAFT_110660 [Gloeophyllum trabeum ATCC 11539]